MMNDTGSSEKQLFKEWLVAIIAEWQHLDTKTIDCTTPFTSLGIRAKKTVVLADNINKKLNLTLSPTIFFQYPTIEKLLDYLFQNALRIEGSAPLKQTIQEPIAIIGMAARAPGAEHTDELWNLLNNKVHSPSQISKVRWNHDHFYNIDPHAPGKIATQFAGFIENSLEFDNNLFPISNAELLEIDPQQRVLLEVAWEAFESAGLTHPQLENKNVGVYIGIHNNDYLRLNLKNANQLTGHSITGGALSVAAGRISYQFGLTGPSMAIDTACSSSALAIHLACQSLRLQECDMAVAGGVNLIFSPDFMIGLTKARMLSPTGHCHTFNANADGYVRSEGCGLIVLKRLEDALLAEDNILAVIRSSAVNQDGASNGLTAPNKTAQISVLKTALARANLSPSQIDYIETHGTGTVLGDLIELESLETVFAENKKLILGSIKTNIGHTETAAGILGLIKVVLAMQKESIPAHLGFDDPNTHFAWGKTNLQIPKENMPWLKSADDSRRYAGISSFGFSGTNVHIILEDTPKISSPLSPVEAEYTLILSAAHFNSLKLLAGKYADFLQKNNTVSLTDFCYSVNHCRTKLPFVLSIKAIHRTEMIEKLQHLNLQDEAMQISQQVIPSAHGHKIPIPTYAFTRKLFSKITPIELVEKSVTTAVSIDTSNLEKYIYAELSTILHTEPNVLNNQCSLSHYGFDSIMALHFKNRLQTELAIDISMQQILGANTLEGIVTDIKELVAKRKAAADLSIPILSRTQSSFKLSTAQQQLWFLQALHPNTAAYNLPVGVKLYGKLNILVLEKSINALRAKHEILRANFILEGNEPVQKIKSFHYLSLPVTATPPLSVSDAITKEAGILLNLAEDNLFSAALIQEDPENSTLVLLFHHIIMDGWSLLENFLPELFQNYRTLMHEENTHSISPKMQYIDYADWQSQTHQHHDLEKSLQYWYHKLANASFKPLLGTDYKRPLNTANKGKRLIISLGETLTQQIILFSKQSNTTVFSVFFSAMYIVLAKWTGENDLIIGTTFSNRISTQLHSLLGDFTNHLPLRAEVKQEALITDFIAAVSRTILEAFENAHCSFQKIVEKLNPPREGNRNPLYNIACVLHAFSGLSTSWQVDPTLEASLISPTGQIDNHTSEIDVLIEIIQTTNEFFIECEYDIEIFHETTIQHFFDTLERVLSQIVTHAHQYIRELNYVDLSTYKTHSHPEPSYLPFQAQPIHQLFTKIAGLYPTKTAVIFENNALSYTQLDHYSNQLARKLLNLNLKPQSIIALYTERSLDMLVGILGILKAGAAYLPLEPQNPPHYLNHILEDAQVTMLVCDKAAAANPKWNIELTTVVIDLEKNPGFEESTPLATDVSLDDTAYIIYTSGSTGKPKGVLISHRHVIALLNSTSHLFNFSHEDVWTLFHSYAFDFSVWEMWGALLYGAKLVILDYMTTRQPAEIYRQLILHEVTVLNQTPSAFKQFCHYYHALKSSLPQLRYIIFGGEKLDLDSLDPWVRQHGFDHPELINMYGITETTVHTTFKQIKSLTEDYYQNVGKILPHLKCYLLDENQKLVPEGASAEIYISGPQIALGYLNKPELTAEKFKQNFIENNNERIYRTGDLGRFLPSGELQYLGRIDNQVKIRGFRIEVKQIEATIKQFPTINDAVVIVDESTQDKTLCAYLVPDLIKLNSYLENDIYLEKWSSIFDTTYTTPNPGRIANYSGWKSSYTGDLIPINEMEAWVQSAVEQINILKPKHILEIGCGTGLLLFNLLNKCTSYTGTDLSQKALDYIHTVLDKTYSEKVHLFHQSADEVAHLQAQTYDVIILNSVIQYFPSLDYLINVLNQLIPFLSPQGFIFLGDIRNYALNNLCNTSVEFHKAKEQATLAEILAASKHRLNEETELLLAPNFFHQLKKIITRPFQVYFNLGEGCAKNEMTKFRYNATLCFDCESSYQTQPALSHHDQPLSIAWLENYIQTQQPDKLALQGVFNQRLSADHYILSLFKTHSLTTRKAACLSEIEEQTTRGINPQAIFLLAKKYHYSAYLNFNEQDPDKCFDCHLIKLTHDEKPFATLCANNLSDSLLAYSNYIPFNQVTKQSIVLLRNYLTSRLPAYMLPSHYTVLRHLPMTPNGKFDKTKLPSPYKKNLEQEIPYVAPSNLVENKLVDILCELIIMDKISVKHKFFHLGGNSIIATQFVARIKSELGLDFPLIKLFNNPTISEMANFIFEIISKEAIVNTVI